MGALKLHNTPEIFAVETPLIVYARTQDDVSTGQRVPIVILCGRAAIQGLARVRRAGESEPVAWAAEGGSGTGKQVCCQA